MATLPITRHDWHGDWNYTLDPHPHPHSDTDTPAPRPPRRDSSAWAHPELTGMPTPEFDHLVAALEVPHQAQHEARLHTNRGGPPRRKPAGGHPPTLTLTEKILATILHTRFRTPQRVLAELFGTNQSTIYNATNEIKPLLHQHKHTTTPAPTRLATLTELTAHAATIGVTLTPGTKPER